MSTPSQEDYLRTIYEIATDLGTKTARISTSLLAARLSVAAPSVTGMVKKLAEEGLFHYTPYQGVELTRRGERVALNIVRRHRLLESLLVQILGYSWDEVHQEAHRLEHAVSDLFVERIAALLGEPESDPHGEPIPTADGQIQAWARHSLLDMKAGSFAKVVLVTDEDPAFLRYLDELGLRPGTPVRLVERVPFAGALKIQVGDREEAIGLTTASRVRVHLLQRD